MDYVSSFKDILIVQHRLPHTHKHDIGDPFTSLPPDRQQLPNNFTSCQISEQSHLCCGAELAFQRTPHLRRETDSLSFPFRNKNCFNLQSVPEFEQKFP